MKKKPIFTEESYRERFSMADLRAAAKKFVGRIDYRSIADNNLAESVISQFLNGINVRKF